MKITKENLSEMILTGDARAEKIIGRALVHLFNRQLDDEKETNSTNHLNLKGFTGADARSGSITAKYYLKHGRLLDWQVERWTRLNKNGTPRLAKYWRQLNEEAKKKEAQVAS